MAWIYLAESEESQKPWRDTCGRSPTVNPIRIAKGSFYPGWILDTFLALRCGTTYELCAAPICPYHRKSSTAVSLARTLVLQDAERVWAESAADYFSRSFGSLARYNRDSFSWRTSQLLLFEEQSELLANFAGSGMTVDGEFYPLRTWARITGENDGGCLPSDGRMWMTPKAGNCGMTARTTGRPLSRSTHLQAQVHCEEARVWPTPQAHDAAKGNPERVGRFGTKHGGRNLNDEVAMWPTPRAEHDSGKHNGKPDTLHSAVKMWPTPRSSPNENRQTKPTPSQMAGEHGKSLAAEVGGQLNPTWVEWLMGYPSEWTVLEPWAMQWFQPKRGKRLKD